MNKRENDYNPLLDGLICKMLNISKEFDPIKVALRVAGIYAIFGVLWILLSDNLLVWLVQDKHMLNLISLLKGWFFVAITVTLIFGLVYTTLRRIQKDKIKIDQNYCELSSTYEELEATYEELTASEEELRQQYDSIVDSQMKLMESEERYRLISEAGNDGIWEEQSNVRYFSDRWMEITGYSRKELEDIGDWQKLIHPEDYPVAKVHHDEHLEGKTPFYCCEYRLKRKDGEYIWIQSRGKASFDGLGNICRIAGSHTDISQLKYYQNKLYNQAYHDALTNLPNRLALFEDIKKIISLAEESKFTLLFIDIDNFKLINDTHGHDFGDQIILLISERISLLLKDQGVLYRLGGDEFIVIFKDMNRQEEAETIAEKIIQEFKNPFHTAKSILRINASIGISLYPVHGRNANELLRCADIAMYKAKDSGGNLYKTYTQSMYDIIIERMLIEEHLHNALENNEFELHYQPQFDISENKITGMEALLRWNNPDLGFVSPMKFIPISEETHFIIPLGKWVLNNACAFLKKLQLQNEFDLTISVNISILQLLQDDFVDQVFEILELNDLKPHFLELEITESILMESYKKIKEKLLLLRREGITIALDDFGKGYSSLSYLKQLPITTLKIDKSFIDIINEDINTSSLTGHIVMMGRSLGLNVVAEGVETEEQLNYLIRKKCHKIQGYLFSKPLPEKDVVDFLQRNPHNK